MGWMPIATGSSILNLWGLVIWSHIDAGCDSLFRDYVPHGRGA
jgi:hypothetical protein